MGKPKRVFSSKLDRFGNKGLYKRVMQTATSRVENSDQILFFYLKTFKLMLVQNKLDSLSSTIFSAKSSIYKKDDLYGAPV